MGNCLVTKLKGTVNNDNLNYLGYAAVKFTEATRVYVRVISTNPEVNTVNVFSKDGEFVVDGMTKTSYDFGNNAFAIQTPPCTVNIQKDTLDQLNCDWEHITTSLDSFQYCSASILSLRHKGLSGNIKSLNTMPNITMVQLENSNIDGSLEELNCQNLTMLSIYQTNISGNIESLAIGTPNIETLNLSFTHVGGSIEGLVNGLASRATKSISGYGLANVTFGGNHYEAFAEGHYTLTWDGISKIAVVIENTSAYTKGYTQAEAEAAFPGKTIIRVDA